MVDIPDYAALQARIAQYIDDTTQTARIPGFIELAERKWDRTLFVPTREVAATATATGERLALPTDCKVVRGVVITGFGQLRQTNPSETFQNATGPRPNSYSVQGSEIVFDPPPTASTPVTILYYQTLPLLSVSVTSNWLLAAHPDLYLFGTLIQASAYLVNDGRIPLWKAAHDETLAEIMQFGQHQRYGGGPLVARPSVSTT